MPRPGLLMTDLDNSRLFFLLVYKEEHKPRLFQYGRMHSLSTVMASGFKWCESTVSATRTFRPAAHHNNVVIFLEE